MYILFILEYLMIYLKDFDYKMVIIKLLEFKVSIFESKLNLRLN